MDNLVVRADENNQYSWDQIRSTYMDGVLFDRLINFDNGTSTQSTYFDGVRVSLLQTDSQLNGGIKPWDTIETMYGPDGAISGRLTMYDNGVVKQESFANGVRVQTAQYDNPQYPGSGGAKSWESIVTYYGTDGQKAGRLITYDNGVVLEESYENGVRSHSRQIDNPQNENGDGAKSWEFIDSYYDAAGNLSGRLTKYDNGVIREQGYENGQKTYMRQIDNPQDTSGQGVKAWDTIETFYGEDGLISGRVTTYDDGRLRLDSFENGVRTYTEIQDNADGTSESQYTWTAINISYDETGKIVEKAIIYDDGRVQLDSYQDGVRTESVIEDQFLFNGGNYAWDQKHFVYAEDGSVASQMVSYDDGDAALMTYQDGVLLERSDYDGDNSEAWLGRTTTYNEDGTVASSETYATQSDLPEDFFMDVITPVFETFA